VSSSTQPTPLPAGPASDRSPDHVAKGGSLIAVAVALLRRNLVNITRLPSALVPSLVFPIFGTIAFASLYGAAIRQYYPSLNALNWYVPLNVVQGAAFGGVFLAFATIRDFQTGVVDRLVAAPMRRRAMLLAVVLTAAVRALFPFVLVMIIGLLGGMSFPGGVAGVLMLLLGCVATGVLGCLWGTGLAYRFKTMAAAPLMQVGVFVLVFLSATQVPMSGLSGWLHTIARVNPATNLLRMSRQGFIGPVTWHDTWPGLLAVLGMGLALTLFADRGLDKIVP
jgi:ABC-2 type transport system permease protein